MRIRSNSNSRFYKSRWQPSAAMLRRLGSWAACCHSQAQALTLLTLMRWWDQRPEGEEELEFRASQLIDEVGMGRSAVHSALRHWIDMGAVVTLRHPGRGRDAKWLVRVLPAEDAPPATGRLL